MPSKANRRHAGERRAFKTWVAPYLARHRLQLGVAIILGITAGAFA